jgi:epoxide hydrolase 4
VADDIRGLIRELGAESALLVGHDFGGTVAWATAMAHPEVVDRLVILNAAHPRRLNEGLKHPNQLRKLWYFFFFFQPPGLPERIVRARHWRFFRRYQRDAQPPYTPEETERYVESWSQPGAAAAIINYYRAAVRQSKQVQAELRPIAAPTLVIWGSATATSAPSSPSRSATMCPTSIASSVCPTPRIGSITTSPSA